MMVPYSVAFSHKEQFGAGKWWFFAFFGIKTEKWLDFSRRRNRVLRLCLTVLKISRQRRIIQNIPIIDAKNLSVNKYEHHGEAQRWEKMSWLVIDSMVDVIFIADVVINFMTSIVSSSGEVIMDPKVNFWPIRNRYKPQEPIRVRF